MTSLWPNEPGIPHPHATGYGLRSHRLGKSGEFDSPVAHSVDEVGMPSWNCPGLDLVIRMAQR